MPIGLLDGTRGCAVAQQANVSCYKSVCIFTILIRRWLEDGMATFQVVDHRTHRLLCWHTLEKSDQLLPEAKAHCQRGLQLATPQASGCSHQHLPGATWGLCPAASPTGYYPCSYLLEFAMYILHPGYTYDRTCPQMGSALHKLTALFHFQQK